MSTLKWSSLAVALLGGAAVVFFAAHLVGASWFQMDMAAAGLAVVLSLLGLLLSLFTWLSLGAYEVELRRVTAHVEAVADDHQRSDAPLRLGFGLDAVARAAHTSVARMQDRLRQLGEQRRALEIRARTAETERRHLEAIVNAISDAILVTDAFNELAMANHAAAGLWRFDPQRARRQPIDRVLDDPTLVQIIKDMRTRGQVSLRRHMEHRVGVNGSAAVYDVTLACVPASPLGPFDASGQVAGVVAILRDITSEKRRVDLKSDSVANVSHELRTPLASIKASMEMLIDGEAHDEGARQALYNIVQGESNRLSRLIDNVLNISRIEAGVTTAQRECIELADLVQQAVEVMQPQARARQISLTGPSGGARATVFADADMIYEALLNLIGNALKYTSEQGEVRVGLAVDAAAQLARVSVSDTGAGIPAADFPYLFDKFYRVADHKKLAKGTGLGLNLVKHVIETVHGGQIEVTSEIGRGTTFTFILAISENVQWHQTRP